MKAADPIWLPRLAVRVWLEASGHGCFGAAFGDRVVLVPVPGSTPVQSGRSVGERLAWCLKEVGLAAAVQPLLLRRHGVRKSAYAATGERPSVLEHHASFAVAGSPWRPVGRCSLAGGLGGARLQLTLVDDVITRGRTLLAAAGKLHEAFPSAQIRAFALLRTLGRGELPRRTLDPCEGEVRWVAGDARRCP